MDADGKHSDLPKTAAPASLWRGPDVNGMLCAIVVGSRFKGNELTGSPLWGKDAIHQLDAFDPDTGKPLSMKVTDLGEEVLTRHDVPRRTHHYKIADTLTGEFARDIWFDGDALVRTKIIGSDNSVILSDLQ